MHIATSLISTYLGAGVIKAGVQLASLSLKSRTGGHTLGLHGIQLQK